MSTISNKMPTLIGGRECRVYNKLHNWIYIFHEWIEVLGLSQAHYSVQVVIHTDEVLIILFLSKVYLSIYES